MSYDPEWDDVEFVPVENAPWTCGRCGHTNEPDAPECGYCGEES